MCIKHAHSCVVLLCNNICVYIYFNHATRTAGSSIGVVVLAVVLSCTYAVQEKKRLAAIKKRYFRQHGGLLLFEEMKQSSSSSRRQGQQAPAPASFTLFTEKELEQATNRFDERHVLGKGGNGTVYRGDLRDGRAVAIKRCRVAGDERQRRELGKEVLILSQVSHRNIVKLYGCCLEVAVPMLVYEFIPNGTLCELLHGQGGEDRATRAAAPRRRRSRSGSRSRTRPRRRWRTCTRRRRRR